MGDDNNAFWGNIISNGMGLLAGGIAEVITDTMKDPVSKFMAKQLLSFTQTAPLDYQLKMRVEDKDFKQSTVEMLGSIAGSEALPLVAGFLVGGPLGFGETALYTLIGGAYGGALTERMFDSDSVMLDYVSEEVHLAGNQCFLGNVGNQWKLVTSNLDVTTYTSPATLPGPPTLLENTLVVKQKSEFENVKYTFDVNTGKLDGVDFESSRLSGYPSAMQDFLLELKKAYPDAFTDGMQIGYIDLHRTYIQIPLDHMVEYDGQVSNSTEIETVHGQNGEVIGYLIPPTSTTTINGVTVNTISLVNMVTQRAKEAGEFLAHTVTNVADAFEDAIFGANRATTLATIATRLVQGESFGSIITSMTEQLVAQTVVTSTLDAVLQDQIGGYLAQAYNAQRVTVTDGIWTVVKQSGEVVQLSGAQARQMANYDAVYKGLAMFAINGILSGDYKQAAETATIQTIVESGFTQIQAFQVYERNLLTGDVLKDPVTGNPLVAGLNPAGAAAMAAAVTLLTSLVSEGQISQQAVGQAVLAASSTLITTTLVAAYTAVTTGTAFSAAFSTAFSNVSALGGPAGIIIGAAVSYALTKLLSGSKTYHDETIGSTVEVQADGSLKVIGLREAGALLRTTGTTDDDYYGTDTSDTNTGGGNDVMVGQAGKNEMYGKGGNDLIEGRAAADYIDGGTGDDHIEAGSGDDFATGGAGNDRIYGQAGNDKLLGDVGDDTILGGDGDDEIEGNDGVDQLFGGTGKDTIAAGAGNDWVDGGTGNDVLNGEAGYDQISGGDGDDIVHGNDGNDLLSGSSGNDDVRGDNGDDIILGDDGVDQLYGGDGNDVLDGGTQNDILFGGLGADTLNGGTGDDDLYGEIGNDFLAGGIGNDLLNGGDGDDVFVYSRGEGKDTIDDTSGANKLKFMDIKATDIASIARVGDDLVLTIDAYNSVTVKNHFITAGITTIEFGDGKAINVAAMTFDTTTGIGSYSLTSGSNLLINYTAQLEKYQELNVTFGASTILSTSWLTTNYDTRVTTDAYDLELYNDVQVRMWQKKAGFFGMRVSVGYYDYFERFLNGSGYSDRIVGMFTDEVIDGAAGNDQLYGNVGNDTVVGGSEHDILFGGTGNDNMQGVGGEDKLFGGSGVDTMSGGEGNDTLYGEIGADIISGDNGDDYLSGGVDNDTLGGGAGRDILYGDDGDDTINGDADDDYLNGGVGNDIMNGGTGNDVLFGGDGNDNMKGGDGDDIFIGGKGTNTINGENGTDTLILSGRARNYTILFNTNNTITVTDNRVDHSDGTNSLYQLEKIQFADMAIDTQTSFPIINSLRIAQGQTYTGKVTVPEGYSISLYQAPAQGTLTIASNGTYTYTASSTYTGDVSFRYRMYGPDGLIGYRDVIITTTPYATPLSYSGNQEIGVGTLAASFNFGSFDVGMLKSSLVKLAGGGYAMAWTKLNTDGSGYNIFYRVYSATSSAVTTELKANLTVVGNQTNPQVFATADGGFIVGWQDANVTGTTGGPTWMKFSATGIATTGEMRNVTPSGADAATIQLAQTVIASADVHLKAVSLPNGNILKIWEDSGSLSGQVISSTGAVVVNTFTFAAGGTEPSLALLANGNLVVTWSIYDSTVDPSSPSGFTYGNDVYAQIITPAGGLVGSAKLVNTMRTLDQMQSSVTALADGGFYVTYSSWREDLGAGGSYEVYGQYFDTSGNKAGPETLINTIVGGHEFLPQIIQLDNGDLLATWTYAQSTSVQMVRKQLTPTYPTATINGTTYPETLLGGLGADTITGNAGDDTLMGSGGNDILDGGAGWDTAQYASARANYTISITDDGTATVTDIRTGSPEGTDTLTNIENLRFSDLDAAISGIYTPVKDIIIAQGMTYNGKITMPAGYTAALVTAPYGPITINSNGTYTYTAPSGNYSGPTSFTYKITSSGGIIKYDTVNINVVSPGTLVHSGQTEQQVGTEKFSYAHIDYDGHKKYASTTFKVSGGNYVVAWASQETSSTDADIYYAVYNANGVMVTSSVLRANISTTGMQTSITGTALADGGFVLAWNNENYASTTTGRGTARVFNSNGSGRTNEFTILPTATTGNWDTPSLAVTQLANGNLGAVWQGRMGVDDFSIYYSQYTLTGAKVGIPVKVNTHDVGNQVRPSFTTLANGNLVVAWEDQGGNDGSSSGVFGQVIAQDGTLVGSEFIIPTSTGDGQADPGVATLVDGGFVVTWSAYWDQNYMGVFGMVYNADGTRRTATQFQVNTFYGNDQKYAKVEALADGGFYVVFTSDLADGSSYGIYGQRYDANGNRIGEETRISDSTAGDQFLPDITQLNSGEIEVSWTDFSTGTGRIMMKRVAMPDPSFSVVGVENFGYAHIDYDGHQLYANSIVTLTGGNYVVAWASVDNAIDGTANNIYYRVYNQAGVALTAATRANTTLAGEQLTVNAVALANGGFALAWEDRNYSSTTTGRGTFRVFDATGNATITEQSIMPAATTGNWDTPVTGLIQLSNGNLGAVWSGRMVVDDFSIYFSQYTSTGTKVGLPIKVNTHDSGNQVRPAATILPNGNIVVVWEDQGANDGSSNGVYGQIITQTGTPVGAEFIIPTSVTDAQLNPTITTLSDGGFVVTWSGYWDQNYMGVFGQMYNIDGTRRNAQFQINTFSGNDQKYSKVEALSDGGFMVVYTSDLADGSSYGVYAQRYTRTGTKVGVETRINDVTTGDQFLPDLTELNNGDIIISWTDFSTGTGRIVQKRLTASGTSYTEWGISTNAETIVGGNTNDNLNGQGGDDTFNGLYGNDSIDGGSGVDTAQYAGNLADYTITMNDTLLTVKDNRSVHNEGTDTIVNLEKLAFADQTVDVTGLFADLPNMTLTYQGTYTGKLTMPSGGTASVVSAPTSGSLVMNADGTFTYAAANAFSGTTTFTYKVTNPLGIAKTHTVTVKVLPAATTSILYQPGAEQVVGGENIEGSRGDYDLPHNFNSKVIKLTGGGYAIVWARIDTDGSLRNVYYRVYDAAGNAVTAATRANVGTTGSQWEPSGTALSNGGFILNWEDDYATTTTNARAVWRVYNAQGVAQTAEMHLLPASTGGYWEAFHTEMLQLPSGNIAVSSAVRMGPEDYNIFYGVYKTDGSVVIPLTQVNTSTAGHQLFSGIAALSNGNVVVVWEDRGGADGAGWGIMGQIMDTAGNKIGSQFAVTSAGADERDPTITTLANGNFVVSWMGLDTSGGGIFGQLYSSTGAALGSRFQANTYTNIDQKYGNIQALSDGGFLIVYASDGADGSGWGIFAQRYDATATRIGTETRINDTTTAEQFMPDVEELANGDLIFTWADSSAGADGAPARLVQKRWVAPTSSNAPYTVTGTTGNDLLVGNNGPDTLTGDTGNDILAGGKGNDTLSGGAGNDTYQFNVGDGQDTIDNADTLGTDVLTFGTGIGREDIWFTQNGYNLTANVLGSTDSVTFQNWFASDSQRVDQFKVEGYTLDKSKVDQLVNAMASFNPQSIGTVTALTDLPSGIQATIAASWS